jgi:L,D-transpeptidase catalytic domain/Putative peptidoglycan binding domain/Scaffold domain
MRAEACVLAAAVLLHGFAVPPAARGADARPAPALAAAAEVRQDPGLNELYAARGFAPLWGGSQEAEERRASMLALLDLENRAEPAGSDADDLRRLFAQAAAGGKREQARAELALTRAALAYLARRSGDISVRTARAVGALKQLDALESGQRPFALAMIELELVRELGGWREVGTIPGPPPTAAPLAVVSPEVDVAPAFPRRKRLPEVRSLRQRLVQSADLPASDLQGPEPDQRLADAVRRFQKRHGLVPDGVVGPATLAALNAPVGEQIARVGLNLARNVADRSGLTRYVEVNVPGYELRLVERGKVVLRSRVVVGDEENPTPIFDDRIRYIEFNPSWYVPASITPELLAKEEKQPGYLEQNGFYWRASAEGAPERLVQRPGSENALGSVKFLFPNHHAVYLHDTPNRKAFGRSQRSLSHGCVRVEKHHELALALLGRDGWDQGRLDAAFASRKTRRVELGETVPVFLDYRTAFVDDDGRLNLRPDLYGHDAGGVTVFKEKGLPPEPVVAQDTPPEPIVTRPLAPPAVLPRPTLPSSIGIAIPPVL